MGLRVCMNVFRFLTPPLRHFSNGPPTPKYVASYKFNQEPQ